jgi:uncharacterized ferredoxin-like protein
MIYKSETSEKRAAMMVADLMVAAAKTAPKGCGVDNVVALVLDGEEKDKLADHMRDIAKETGAEFFSRDADNTDNSHCMVLIAVRDNPLLLDHCSLCGFENCGEMRNADAKCAFNVTDLGIAVGSAVSIAADNRIDNRVMFSAGKAAIRMECFPSEVKICYGIPLSTSAKSIFFDRDPGSVLV